jgi:hypothetical protein
MNKEYLNTISKYPSAWTGHANFAVELVKAMNPYTIVDLGVDYGFSTFCFAYPKIGMVYGIDWFEGDNHASKRNTYDKVKQLSWNLAFNFDITNVDFIKSDFTELSKVWNMPIDILHIDGFHEYEAVKNDYECWSKHCHEDSIILFHDVESFRDTVGRFFSELPGEYKLINRDSAGLGVYTKSIEVFDKVEAIFDKLQLS